MRSTSDPGPNLLVAAHPARRGGQPRLPGEGPRLPAATPGGPDGLPLRHRLRRPPPEAYERLLLDVMLGDPTLFTRTDEVEAPGVRHADPRRLGRPARPRPPDYVAGTWGPDAADRLLASAARPWRQNLMTARRRRRPARDVREPNEAGPPPVLAWRVAATSSIEGIQQEFARIWTPPVPWAHRRRPRRASSIGRVSARTSVMNLVVVAPPAGNTASAVAAIIHDLTGRHPSRTLIVTPARSRRPVPGSTSNIQAHCMVASVAGTGDVRRDDLPDHAAARPAATSRRSSPRCSSTTCRSPLWWPDEPPPADPHERRTCSRSSDRLVDRRLPSWHGSRPSPSDGLWQDVPGAPSGRDLGLCV